MKRLNLVNTIKELANHIYHFLPGNPHPYGDQSISFRGIAKKFGLLNFWQEGSKLPAIINFLEKILEYRSDLFYPIIVEIVYAGIKYRRNKENPITREEIEKFNELLLKLNYKIPELWDKDFLNSLPSPKEKSETEKPVEKGKVSIEKIKELQNKLLDIERLEPNNLNFSQFFSLG